MFLFCYYSKGTMIGSDHKANDDCALCKAWTKNKRLINSKNFMHLQIQQRCSALDIMTLELQYYQIIKREYCFTDILNQGYCTFPKI